MSSAAEDEFKAIVKAYIDMYDQLAQAGKQLRDIRRKKAELADVIVQYMRKNDIDECSLADGKLIRKTSSRMEPLNKTHVLDTLKKAVGEDKAEDLLLNIFDKRAVTQKDTLRRTRKRSSTD